MSCETFVQTERPFDFCREVLPLNRGCRLTCVDRDPIGGIIKDALDPRVGKREPAAIPVMEGDHGAAILPASQPAESAMRIG